MSAEQPLIHHVYANVYIAGCNSATIESLSMSNIITLDVFPDNKDPFPNLESIFHFNVNLHEHLLSADGQAVIICDESMRYSVSLIGAYLILVEHCDLQVVLNIVKTLHDAMEPNQDELYFRALHHAQNYGWINHYEEDGRLIADNLEEHIHYSRTENGKLNIVIPGKLIIVPKVHDVLDSNTLWKDVLSSEHLGADRHFSASFYAELLRHLGVAILTCLGPADERTVMAMENCGLACEDQLVISGSRSIFRPLDRILSLNRAGAAVALLCDDAHDAGRVRLLVLARLVQLGMSGVEAEAWLHLTCPALDETTGDVEREATSSPF